MDGVISAAKRRASRGSEGCYTNVTSHPPVIALNQFDYAS